MRRFLSLLVLILVVAAVGLVGTVSAVSTAFLPIVVVRDGDGDVIGPAVGYDNEIPVVVISDPVVGGRDITVEVASSQGFRTQETQVFYESDDCSGLAFLPPPSTRGGLRELTGISYAVGLGSGGQLFLFRSTSSGPGTAVQWDSVYSTTNPDFDDPANCQASSSTTTLVPTTTVLNINNLMPPPYCVDPFCP